MHRFRLFCRFVLLLSLLGSGRLSAADDDSPFLPIKYIPRIPAVIDPPHQPADQVTRLEVRDDELVIGLVVSNEARAYPLNMISGPDVAILNDVLGGRKIAVTWCSICYRPLVFDRQVKEQVLDFAADGSLWRNNLVMYDVQTESFWSQFLSRAEAGPLRGTVLEQIPSVLTGWGEWKGRYPKTTVLALKRSVDLFSSSFHRVPRGIVFELVQENPTVAYFLDALKREPVLNDTVEAKPIVVTLETNSFEAAIFSRRVGEQVLTFEPNGVARMKDRETGSIWDLSSGRCLEGDLEGKSLVSLPTGMSIGPVWAAFYPEGQFRQPGKPPVDASTDLWEINEEAGDGEKEKDAHQKE